MSECTCPFCGKSYKVDDETGEIDYISCLEPTGITKLSMITPGKIEVGGQTLYTNFEGQFTAEEFKEKYNLDAETMYKYSKRNSGEVPVKILGRQK